MDIGQVKDILEFAFDKSRGIILNIIIFVSVIFCFLLIDDYFNFSYDLKINAQIEQISKLETIINNSKDSTMTVKFRELENNIIEKGIRENYFTSLFSEVILFINTHSKKAVTNISANPIIHYLSSNWVWLIFIFWIFKGFNRFIVTQIIWVIMAAGMSIVVIFFINGWLTALIVPSEISPLLKVLLNFAIQGILGIIIYSSVVYSGYRDEKKKEKSKDKSAVNKEIKESDSKKSNDEDKEIKK